MFKFSRKESPNVDEHAANVGAADAPRAADNATAAASAVSVASATRDAAATNARDALKRKRGRPPSDGSGTGNAALTDRALQEKINAQIGAQLERLHEPKLWSSMLCMPAAGMHALTGKDRWEFSKEERDTIGLAGAALAETMMITNPRALAALMFVSIVGTAYVPRAVAEFKDYADKKKAEKKKEPPANETVAKP